MSFQNNNNPLVGQRFPLRKCTPVHDIAKYGSCYFLHIWLLVKIRQLHLTWQVTRLQCCGEVVWMEGECLSLFLLQFHLDKTPNILLTYNQKLQDSFWYCCSYSQPGHEVRLSVISPKFAARMTCMNKNNFIKGSFHKYTLTLTFNNQPQIVQMSHVRYFCQTGGSGQDTS